MLLGSLAVNAVSLAVAVAVCRKRRAIRSELLRLALHGPRLRLRVK